ncbi:hypothetical protein TNCT_535671 [Trichonephila clavata]|uniref:Uncharacterized protein n=1 Tax=Trichonephila clavata TaxID=2740835 RepID=A0A8X6LW00_TRICU|nr:hypothetical protein TNCT_535671 [Trichonephila clavata]
MSRERVKAHFVAKAQGLAHVGPCLTLMSERGLCSERANDIWDRACRVHVHVLANQELKKRESLESLKRSAGNQGDQRQPFEKGAKRKSELCLSILADLGYYGIRWKEQLQSIQ